MHNLTNYRLVSDVVVAAVTSSLANDSLPWYNDASFNATTVEPLCGWFDNSSTCDGNVTTAAPPDGGAAYPFWQIVLLSTLAGLTTLVTILGNMVVVLSFYIERSIRQPTNYFIASLACSDLLIGSISMPFYTVYLLMGQRWILGEILCDIWLSIDYTVCLTSIYTVFCITVDRYCMVRIPARYRTWRTRRKVLVIIALTWLMPVLVFFTSIIGWQYFVGKRTVRAGQCYVQYMELAAFNLILQVGYFWTTLVVMIVLYSGIYKVALTLQRKKEFRQRKMTSLVSMAGQTMTKIGIGMSQQQSANAVIKSMQAAAPPGGGATALTAGKTHAGKTSLSVEPPHASVSTSAATSSSTTTGFSSKPNHRDEDRSSSPAYPSDTDPSSQSPNQSQRARGRRAGKSSGKSSSSGKSAKRRTTKAENNNRRKKAAKKSTGHVNGDAFESATLLAREEEERDAPPLTDATGVTAANGDSSDDSSVTSPVWKRRRSATGNGDRRDGTTGTGGGGGGGKKNVALRVQVNSSAAGHVVTRVADGGGDRPAELEDDARPAPPACPASPGVLRTFLAAAADRTHRMRNATHRGADRRTTADRQASKSENRARKALRTITIILGAFVFCWTPWHVFSLVLGFCPADVMCIPATLYDISYWLCYLNSPINPLCYALVNQQFKKTFARIMRFDWHRT